MQFKVRFNKESKRFPVQFRATNQKIDVKFENLSIVTVTEDVEHYMGSYEVVPSPSSVVLPTEKKLMNADVTVHAIPFFSVGNNSGGNTVYIGSEKEINIM